MKKIILSAFTFLITVCASAQDSTYVFTYDSVMMGTGFTNQAFYKMNGKVKQEYNNTDWDLMISTGLFTSNATSLGNTTSIWTNAQRGVEIYTYTKGDKAAFATADTTGLSLLPQMYNSDQTLGSGSLNRYKNANPFDFGWGVYGFFATDHSVDGDSLFIIKSHDGVYRKLFVEQLHRGVWKIKYANLDNSNMQTMTFDKKDSTYGLQNFTHLSFKDNKLFILEPVSTKWDVTFTQYHAVLPNGKTETRVGILTNEFNGVMSAEAVDSKPFAETATPATFVSNISEIGYDWNNYVSGFTPISVNSPVYFIKSDSTYKIQLAEMNPQNGKVKFIVGAKKEAVQQGGSNSISANKVKTIGLYPNPAADILNLNQSINGKATILNVSGQIVLTTAINGTQINTANIANGFYTLLLEDKNGSYAAKFNIVK